MSGLDAWNRVSRELRGIAVASTFKRHLKAELFSRAYGVSLADSSGRHYLQLTLGHFRVRCFIDVTCLMLFILNILLLPFGILLTLICLHCFIAPSSLVGGAIENQLID